MVNITSPGRGRRAGTADTRAAILRAARETFANESYEGASIRRIAGRAGVDPALVLHYFGTKEGLFDEAVDFPFDPDALMERVFSPGPGGVGRRLAEAFLGMWESDEYGLQLRGIFRAAVSSEAAAAKLRQMVEARLLPAVSARLPDTRLAERAPLVLSQLLGVAVLRYVVRIGPMAEMPREELVEHLATTIDHAIARLAGDRGMEDAR